MSAPLTGAVPGERMQITFEEMLLLQASWCFLLLPSGLDTGSSGSGSGRAGVFGSVGVLGLVPE